MDEERWEGMAVDRVEVYVRGLFSTPAAQLAFTERANAVRGWGFGLEDFRLAAGTIPTWPDGKFTALVLVVVPRWEARRTLTDLAALAAGRANAYLSRPFLSRAVADLRLPPHPPALRWEAVDFGTPDASRSPSLLLLSAAAQHPEWLRAMSRGRAPSLFFPGTVELPRELEAA